MGEQKHRNPALNDVDTGDAPETVSGDDSPDKSSGNAGNQAPGGHEWKAGDRVCFAGRQFLQVFTVRRVHVEEPRIEISGVNGLFASHLFVPAPAEPIDMPPVTFGAPKEEIPQDPPTVVVALEEWLKHSRDAGSLHVAIPCDAVEEILKLLREK